MLTSNSSEKAMRSLEHETEKPQARCISLRCCALLCLHSVLTSDSSAKVKKSLEVEKESKARHCSSLDKTRMDLERVQVPVCLEQLIFCLHLSDRL